MVRCTGQGGGAIVAPCGASPCLARADGSRQAKKRAGAILYSAPATIQARAISRAQDPADLRGLAPQNPTYPTYPT